MKKAFSMLELVFIIVIIGILASVIIPRTETNPLRESAIKLLSHIRYTQHLAMVNDKFASTGDANWYKKRWQIVFSNSSYSIVSGTTYAIDAQTRKDLRDIDLKATITLSDGCQDKDAISFDYVGRPLINNTASHTSIYSNLLTSICTITLASSTDETKISLEINPETGFAKIN